MASSSWPNPGHSSGAVTTVEYEQLAAPGIVSGLIGTPALSAMVYADSTGLHVKVRANRQATVRAAHYDSGSSEITLTITANSSGSVRTDLVVLRLDRNTGQVAEYVITGSPGGGAPSPVTTISTTGYWDLPLAAVTVPSGATTITAGQVDEKAWYVAASGIACRSSTRPPVESNLEITEYDTGIAYKGIVTSDGGRWVMQWRDSGQIAMPNGGGWDASILTYQRQGNLVIASISATRTSTLLWTAPDSVICTLPVEARPSAPAEIRSPAQFWTNSGTVTQCLVRVISATGKITVTDREGDLVSGRNIFVPPMVFFVP